MTWICPYCGYTNKNDPLNTRHRPQCGGCDEKYDNPEVLLDRKLENIKELKTAMHACHLQQVAIRSRIESLQTELSSEKIELQNEQADYSGMHKDLTKWENTKVYGLNGGEIDKAAKAALDIHQVKLPFEVSA